MQTRGVQGRVFAGQRPHERTHRGRQLGARAGKGEPFVVAVAEFLGVSGGHKLGEDLEPHRGQTRLWEGRADVIRATSWEYGRRERPGRKREAARLTDAAAAGRMLGLESGRRFFRDTSGVSRSRDLPPPGCQGQSEMALEARRVATPKYVFGMLIILSWLFLRKERFWKDLRPSP